VVKARAYNEKIIGSFELAGDTDLTSKYCTFIDWQQSHHSGRSRNRLGMTSKCAI
jgi:hypothetical protein